MLYLQRSQINVPRDRRQGTLPALNVAVERLCAVLRKKAFLRKLRTAKSLV